MGASLAGCYVRAPFLPSTSTPVSKFPTLKNRGHQESRKKIHVTTIFSQMWEEPIQSKLFLILLAPREWTQGREKEKKKILKIILLNKSMYFKKFLVFGEEKWISDMAVPKTLQ